MFKCKYVSSGQRTLASVEESVAYERDVGVGVPATVMS
jgi:hypothetical protein